MRSLFAVFFFSLGMVPAYAQDAPSAEAALNYAFVHTNAPPGGCGCISMNGGSGSFAFHLSQGFAVVADFGVVHSGNVSSSGLDLTLTSYLVGPRFLYHTPRTRVVPYGQVLIGAVHATGGLAPANSNGATSSSVFAAALGGGLDIPVTRLIVIRPVQVEYLVSTLPNGINSHQNNLRVSSGLVFRFGRRKDRGAAFAGKHDADHRSGVCCRG